MTQSISAQYEALMGRPVPNRYKNDEEWMLKKIEEEGKKEETIEEGLEDVQETIPDTETPQVSATPQEATQPESSTSTENKEENKEECKKCVTPQHSRVPKVG